MAQRAIGLTVGLLVILHFIKTTLFVFRTATVTQQSEAFVFIADLAEVSGTGLKPGEYLPSFRFSGRPCNRIHT